MPPPQARMPAPPAAMPPPEPTVPAPNRTMPPPGVTPAPPSTALLPPPLPRQRKSYDGPRSGVTTWSGQLDKGQTVTIDGRLPGVPVMINLDTKEFAIVEAPSPANGWNRVVIRSKSRRHTVVSIQWTVL